VALVPVIERTSAGACGRSDSSALFAASQTADSSSACRATADSHRTVSFGVPPMVWIAMNRDRGDLRLIIRPYFLRGSNSRYHARNRECGYSQRFEYHVMPPDSLTCSLYARGVFNLFFSGFRAICGAVYFDTNIRHELTNDRRPGRFVFSKELRIDPVHPRELRAVSHEDRHLHHIRHRRPDTLEKPFYIVQHEARLVLNIAWGDLVRRWIHRHLPREKDEIPRAYRR
jgi:hypothetical protein